MKTKGSKETFEDQKKAQNWGGRQRDQNGNNHSIGSWHFKEDGKQTTHFEAACFSKEGLCISASCCCRRARNLRILSKLCMGPPHPHTPKKHTTHLNTHHRQTGIIHIAHTDTAHIYAPKHTPTTTRTDRVDTFCSLLPVFAFLQSRIEWQMTRLNLPFWLHQSLYSVVQSELWAQPLQGLECWTHISSTISKDWKREGSKSGREYIRIARRNERRRSKRNH